MRLVDREIQKHDTFFVPEAPGHPGLYANDTEPPSGFTVPKQPATYSIHHAIKFSTEVECADWCKQNPIPVFTPKSHGYM